MMCAGSSTRAVGGLRLPAERTDLTAQLSSPMARRQFVPVQDRRRVLGDVVVILPDGGREASDNIHMLRHQGGVRGVVALPPTGRALKIAGRVAHGPRCPWP